MTQRSQLLDELYGEQESKNVFHMLEDLDPMLNAAVQNIAYNYFWDLEGLSIRDKSLITLTILVSLGKEPQTRPHMIGFLNTGGTVDELLGALAYLSSYIDNELFFNCLNTLDSILLKKSNESKLIEKSSNLLQKKISNHDTFLSARDTNIVNVAMNVALCNPEKIAHSINNFLMENSCKEQDLRLLLIHQIVYCGFPTVINAFNILKKVLLEKK